MTVDIDIDDICKELKDNGALDANDVTKVLAAMDHGEWDHVDAMYIYAMKEYRGNDKEPPELDG